MGDVRLSSSAPGHLNLGGQNESRLPVRASQGGWGWGVWRCFHDPPDWQPRTIVKGSSCCNRVSSVTYSAIRSMTLSPSTLLSESLQCLVTVKGMALRRVAVTSLCESMKTSTEDHNAPEAPLVMQFRGGG